MRKLIFALLLIASPAWAAYPSVLGQQLTGDTSNVTTHTYNYDTAPSSGQLLIIIVGCDGNPTITWTGYTELYKTNSGTSTCGGAAYRYADGTEDTTDSFSTGTVEKCVTIAMRISGHHTSTAPQASTSATGTSSTPDPPAGNPAWGAEDTLWIATEHSDGTSAATGYPTSYTDNQLTGSSNPSSNTSEAKANRNLNNTTDDPSAFAISASQQWVANIIMVRPAGGEPPPCALFIALMGVGCR